MRILGCFKIVPDLDRMAPEDWIAGENHFVDTSFVKRIWSCFDETVLEIMLRLRDAAGEQNDRVTLESLTIGDILCEKYLKTLYALGYTKAVRIACETKQQFWPELTAGLIAGYVSQHGGQDAVLMGIKSGDEENGKVPLLTAELLGWPCITQVVGISPVDGSTLQVSNLTDAGTWTRNVTCPCVLALGDIPGTYLRVPTLKERMQLGKRPVEVLQKSDLCPDDKEYAVQAQLTGLVPVTAARAGSIIQGENTKEQVQILYHDYLNHDYLKSRLEH